MPQRAASKRADGWRSAAALPARCRVRCVYAAVAARNRSTCCSTNAASVSPVARWLIRPTTSAGGSGSSERPQRPMPVSSLRCTRTPAGSSPFAITSSSCESRASATSRLPAGPMTTIRARGNSRRSSSPSGTVATQSAVAPAPSAAPATSAAPWPYPFAFTTAQSSAPSSARRSVFALRRSAARSIVSSERCTSLGERPRQGVDQVACDETGSLRRLDRRALLRGGRGGCGELWLQAFGEERRDDAREHVPAAGGRERGKAERRHEDAAARRRDERVRPFQHDDACEPLRCLLHAGETVRGDLVGLASQEAAELSLVR